MLGRVSAYIQKESKGATDQETYLHGQECISKAVKAHLGIGPYSLGSLREGKGLSFKGGRARSKLNLMTESSRSELNVKYLEKRLGKKKRRVTGVILCRGREEGG